MKSLIRNTIGRITFGLFTALYVCSSAAGPMVGDYLSYFNIPPRGGSSQTIHNKLLEYILGAVPGSQIFGHITTINKIEITNALINAKQRGVDVYLVQNGESPAGLGLGDDGDMLHLHLHPGHKYCYKDQGPIGPSVDDLTSCVSNINEATHHIKNWMFSRTVVDGVLRTYSTWVTSYNLTSSSGDEMFNDVFIVNDNYDLYGAYTKSFDHFYYQIRTNDFYNVPNRGHHIVPSANTEISYAPHTASPGHTEYHISNDHVALALARVDGYEPGCTLKIANLSFSSSRSAVVEKLGHIRALGCRVQVVFSDAHGSIKSDLLKKNIEVREAVKTETNNKTKIHSKIMLYKGRYDGTSNRTFVWGGSHNLTMSSLRERDEVFVAISRLGIYTNYDAYFNQIWVRSDVVR